MVVGNPKPASRTMGAAHRLVEDLGYEVAHSVDLADLGTELLAWKGDSVTREVAAVRGLDLVVVASPTYKATYTGLLMLFLENFESGTGLADTVAVPLMLGGSMRHALAPELHLKPLLVELGASCPTEAAYFLEREEEGAAGRKEWIDLDLDLRVRLARWGAVLRP